VAGQEPFCSVGRLFVAIASRRHLQGQVKLAAWGSTEFWRRRLMLLLRSRKLRGAETRLRFQLLLWHFSPYLRLNKHQAAAQKKKCPSPMVHVGSELAKYVLLGHRRGHAYISKRELMLKFFIDQLKEVPKMHVGSNRSLFLVLIPLTRKFFIYMLFPSVHCAPMVALSFLTLDHFVTIYQSRRHVIRAAPV
jgi:hypothetical protein